MVSTTWSPSLAYAVGLIATDGYISQDGRFISLSSKDIEQLENFKRCLGIENKIGKNVSGLGKVSWRVQFGDVTFQKFLREIGITPAKSKTIGAVKVPKEYFFDFLRGVFDGDGSFYSYKDPRWKSSFMFYTIFASASEEFIRWLRGRISQEIAVKGHVTTDMFASIFQLKYAKAESVKIIHKLYYSQEVVCLSRKRLKIRNALGIVGEHI